ncbi:MAG TPA: dihydropteroate synthase [Bacteroidales bacterium]|nr:dihydropteroate synthase [Bacteroidales bacterium]
MVNNRFLNCRGKLVSLEKPLIMGILNVTPDSFFDGDRYSDEKSWLERTGKMLDEGADIIDVGCVSTRPGAKAVDEKEEIKKVVFVLDSLAAHFPDAIISIDTYRAAVAHEAVHAGAAIINDISGGTMDPDMYQTIAYLRVPYILMHISGTPETMQQNPVYQNVTKEIINFFAEKSSQLRHMGINDIIIDPGFGFGKTPEHNMQLLREIHLFRFLPHPLLIGISRKSMIWKTLKCTPAEALNGTTVLHTLACLNNAAIIRVHDVKEAQECLTLVNKIYPASTSGDTLPA